MEKLQSNPILSRRFFLLTATELRQLAGQGMSIGAHTLHHPMLSRALDSDARLEIVESRRVLEVLLDRQVWAFAYPFGDAGSFTPRDLDFVQAAKYTCAFTNTDGGFGAELPRFALPRVHVTAEMDIAELEAHVSGFYRKLRGRRVPSPIVAKS